MNFGAFAGGAAKGWSQGIEDRAKRDDAERKKKESERQDDERKQMEEVYASATESNKEKRKINSDGVAMPRQDAYGAEPAKPGMLMDGIINNQATGRQPAPASVNSIVAQGVGGLTAEPQSSDKPLSVATQGIMRPTAETEMLRQAKAAEPKYRDMDHNDRFEIADNVFTGLLGKGLYEQAAKVGQFRSGLLAEKLQAEKKDIEDTMRSGVMAVRSKNPQAIKAALENASRFAMDGKDVTSFEVRGDGIYEIGYGDDKPRLMNSEELTSTFLAAGDINNLVKYDQQIADNKLNLAKEKRLAKHQDAALKNQSAELGIRQSEHKDKRADTEKQKADAIEKANAAVAIHKQLNPNATPVELEAVRVGVLKAVADEVKNKFDFKVDQFGNTVTVGNVGTGETNIHDVRKGTNTRIPFPGAQPGGAAGLVVGATTKQPDGIYSAADKKVTISGGKITRIE